MRQVLRNEQGEITHIFYDTTPMGFKRYLSVRDFETAITEPITEEMLAEYTGEDGVAEYRKNMLEVLNREWTIEDFRLSILTLTDKLQDRIKLI